MYRTVTPPDAKTLLDAEGFAYVDVRTEAEFAAGHPDGAINVPVVFMGPMGMEPNPDFVHVIAAHLPKDAKLVLGCKSGGRSARACEILAANGYTNLVNMDGGFHGRFDPMGRLIQPGWSQCGLPESVETGDGIGYSSLSAKAEGQ